MFVLRLSSDIEDTFSLAHLDCEVNVVSDALHPSVDLSLSTSEFKQEETCTAEDDIWSSIVDDEISDKVFATLDLGRLLQTYPIMLPEQCVSVGCHPYELLVNGLKNRYGKKNQMNGLMTGILSSSMARGTKCRCNLRTHPQDRMEVKSATSLKGPSRQRLSPVTVA